MPPKDEKISVKSPLKITIWESGPHRRKGSDKTWVWHNMDIFNDTGEIDIHMGFTEVDGDTGVADKYKGQFETIIELANMGLSAPH